MGFGIPSFRLSMPVDFRRILLLLCLAHALALSARHFFARKSPCERYEYALGES